jgi:hypothetical protein
VSAFRYELRQAPRSWSGGHFAVWEQPSTSLEDVRATLRLGRAKNAQGMNGFY